MPLVALTVCVMMYGFGAHMSRMIVFDEIGLQNPVYTFFATGRMTYPMHGQPDFMVVHPPTHYAITALLMKLGLPLFAASAIPIIVLTAILAVVVITGPFSAVVATGLLLGYFVALTTWSEFYTLRPDLHVTAAWFTALVTLESARLRGWSPRRLFVGSALAVLAAAVHYWGISALVLPLIYSGLLVRQHGIGQSRRQLVAVAAGGCLVGLPFLLWFVIPLYTRSCKWWLPSKETAPHWTVQTSPRQLRCVLATARPRMGRAAGSVSARRSGTFAARACGVSRRAAAALAQTDARPAIAGAVLPLFVLFLSQGKQVGYTGYFAPEFILIFAGLLIAALTLIQRVRPPFVGRTAWTTALIVVPSVVAFLGVPTSMGNTWAWTERLDALDLERGAAEQVIGSSAVVAVTSAGVWFTGGGTFVWNAFNELVEANQRGDVTPMLEPVDAVVLDTNWWNARSDLAPTGTWYANQLLHLKGFVLPTTDHTRHMIQLFMSITPPDRVKGFFIEDHRAREFVEDSAGSDAIALLVCNRTPSLTEFAGAYYRFAFAYDRAPAPASPSIVVLGMPASQHSVTAGGCAVRDHRVGRLHDVTLSHLREEAETGPPIQFFSNRVAALMSAGRVPRRIAAPE